LIVSLFVAGLGRTARTGLIEMHNLRTGWLLQRKLIVGQRFIYFQFDHTQRDVVILPRPFDRNRAREVDPVEVFVVLVVNIGGNVSLLVINPLPVRE
jgi:hypothetical protein